jgi:hypothetical protein
MNLPSSGTSRYKEIKKYHDKKTSNWVILWERRESQLFARVRPDIFKMDSPRQFVTALDNVKRECEWEETQQM